MTAPAAGPAPRPPAGADAPRWQGGAAAGRLLPTAAEAATLRFLVPMPDLRTRLLVAGLLFVLGLAGWALLPCLGVAGLLLVLFGHLAIWVRSQTTAPGGGTPHHEDVWAPVEEGWLRTVTDLEARGERWDASPWDLSSPSGFGILLVVLLALGSLSAALLATGSPEPGFRVLVGGAFLLGPLWLNGMRTTWNPSELRKKGEALALAEAVAEETQGRAGDEEALLLEPVPMLALRQGRRGPYPVDARLMLRPGAEDGSGLLGVQVQVALNNVRGTDHPYVYAVVLGKTGAKHPFLWPDVPGRQRAHGVDVVFERGESGGATFLVVRQHADRGGGWHTGEAEIRVLVRTALRIAAQARALNAPSGRESSE